MKKIVLACLILAAVGMSCNNGEKEASGLLQRAEKAWLSKDYSLAKMQIDSIRTLYPKAFDVRKAGIRLMQQVDLSEQQQTLAYLDSMMLVKEQALDSVRGQFILEKDTAYQEVGNYFYPSQVVEKNIGRTFLRAQVSENGVMSLTSVYCGGKSIHHTAVRVSVGGGEFAETPVSADSYETDDLGKVIEKADYQVGNDGGVAAFIVANCNEKRIKLEFLGDRNYQTFLRPDDVKAVVAVTGLARILSAIAEIKKEQKEARLKLQFVQRKIEESKNIAG